MTYRQLLETGTRILKESNIDEYDVDAFELFEYTTGMKRASYILNTDEQVSEAEKERYLHVINKRSTRYPLQYITGTAWFYGTEYYVNESVLIPRFDTENLVELILQNEKESESFLDICTGSGCIAIAIKDHLKNIKATASDISDKALEVARTNANGHNDEITFIQSDLFENINGKYDFIVSNPPYIERDVIKTLMPEVKDYEPLNALDGGEDGLDFYKKIIEESPAYLNKKGRLYFEIGYNQAGEVNRLMRDNGFEDILIKTDLSGNDRCVMGILR
ncbi:MAG: peptide chain release factor N(5)-glutamine methyltransferase [Lachnospiraceae bacterium]|nr:peptide chain release factor N(5)-glutamine methyltransferase [Lachnospiraceae bacterium]